MKKTIQILLNTTAEQGQRLDELRAQFAAACNAVAPVAAANRCWNRVALHHLVYRGLRANFPALGSQMACNAIFSVARTYRILLTHPQSPWNLTQRPNQPLPRLQFAPGAPVYFDRHTLSIKANTLSMFSLDGRLRFEIELADADRQTFETERLREVVLLGADNRFFLRFFFDDTEEAANTGEREWPEYVVVTTPRDPPALPATAEADGLTLAVENPVAVEA